MTNSCDACGGGALEWRGGNGVCMSCGTACEGSAIVPDPAPASQLAANFFSPHDANAPDEHGVPPLHRAVRAGFEAEVAELVAFRANVNARDALGQTALQIAIEEGHAGIADLLIEAGADVDAQTTTVMPRTVMTNMPYAATQMTTILDYLEETVLMLAIKRRRLEIVDKLIKAGADVDADDCHGETALTLAVKDGLLGIVDKLIEAGADNLSLFDCDGLLHRAIEDGCEPARTSNSTKVAKCHFRTRPDWGKRAWSAFCSNTARTWTVSIGQMGRRCRLRSNRGTQKSSNFWLARARTRTFWRKKTNADCVLCITRPRAEMNVWSWHCCAPVRW